MAEKYRRIVLFAIGAWAAIGGLALLLLVLMTGVGVFFRYVLNMPINGLRDISQMLLLLCVSGAIPLAAIRGSHVAVDLLSAAGSPRLRKSLAIMVGTCSCMLLATMIFALARQASCGFRCGQFTPDLVIPFWPMYLALGIGILLYLLQIVAQGLRTDQASLSKS